MTSPATYSTCCRFYGSINCRFEACHLTKTAVFSGTNAITCRARSSARPSSCRALMKLVSTHLVDVELGQGGHESLSRGPKARDVERRFEHDLRTETFGLVARLGAATRQDDDWNCAIDRSKCLEEGHRKR